MAWYRCGGGGSGKDRPIYKTLKIHSGKINIRDGTIESDSTYYYTDAMPFSSDITFDMGLAQSGLNYDGIALYDSSDAWVDFYAPTQRYRNISYSGNATICRLSFRASNLHYIMFHDWINNIMYSTEEVVRITDKESHDIDLIPNPATSESTEPFANSEYAAELAVWKAFDKSKSTFWASANSNGDKYIGWKFSSAVAVNKVYMAIGSNSGWEIHQAPNTWFVEGSNDDGTTWNIVNYNEHSWTNAYEEIEYEFLNETAYKWWRIRITSTMDGTSGCASLAELDFYNVCDSYQLGTKTITKDGTYSAKDDGVDGYSEVTVDAANEIVIFENGQWLNPEGVSYTISPTGSEYIYIEDDELVYGSGTTGVSVAATDQTKYISLKAEFSIVKAEYCFMQTGRCAPGADARRCQNEGYQRYSYHDHQFSAITTDRSITIMSNKPSEAVFLSGDSTTDTIRIKRLSALIQSDIVEFN